MEAELVEDLPFGCLGERGLVENEEGSGIATAEFLGAALIVTPEIGEGVSTIHAADWNWHRVRSLLPGIHSIFTIGLAFCEPF